MAAGSADHTHDPQSKMNLLNFSTKQKSSSTIKEMVTAAAVRIASTSSIKENQLPQLSTSTDAVETPRITSTTNTKRVSGKLSSNSTKLKKTIRTMR